MKFQGNKTLVIIKLLILLILIIGIPSVLFVMYRDTLFNTTWLEQELPLFLEEHKRQAGLIIIGAQIFQIIIPFLPGQAIQFAASYIFGIIPGYILSIIGSVIGTIIVFPLARLLGADALHMLFGEEQIEDYHHKLNSGRGLLLCFIIYLIPGLPKDVVAYAAGISEMRFKPFLIISTIGRTPGMLGSLLLGHFYETSNYVGMIIVAVIAIGLFALGIIKRNKILEIMDRLEEESE